MASATKNDRVQHYLVSSKPTNYLFEYPAFRFNWTKSKVLQDLTKVVEACTSHYVEITKFLSSSTFSSPRRTCSHDEWKSISVPRQRFYQWLRWDFSHLFSIPWMLHGSQCTFRQFRDQCQESSFQRKLQLGERRWHWGLRCIFLFYYLYCYRVIYSLLCDFWSIVLMTWIRIQIIFNSRKRISKNWTWPNQRRNVAMTITRSIKQASFFLSNTNTMTVFIEEMPAPLFGNFRHMAYYMDHFWQTNLIQFKVVIHFWSYKVCLPCQQLHIHISDGGPQIIV